MISFLVFDIFSGSVMKSPKLIILLPKIIIFQATRPT